jgi:putative ABC transport system ATP-binding protein
MEFFHHLNKDEGRTIVFVTHDPDLAKQANRMIVIKDGRIC